MPDQLGHEVQASGEYEYCIGCGRRAKATHIESARIIIRRRVACEPVTRYNKYLYNGHEVKFEDWRACNNCTAKGSGINEWECGKDKSRKRKV
eukprot:3731413-Heterocapsa_arctica.AAC.1